MQLIDDVNGQYQYSTQFGISKENCVASSSVIVPRTSSVVVPASSSVVAPASSSVVAPSSSAAGGYGYPIAVSSAPAYYPTTTMSTKPATPVVPIGTGYPHNNATKSYSAPGSYNATATATRNGTAVFTGAADAKQAGLTFVGAFAALAYFL